jgi:hypothetical protein
LCAEQAHGLPVDAQLHLAVHFSRAACGIPGRTHTLAIDYSAFNLIGLRRTHTQFKLYRHTFSCIANLLLRWTVSSHCIWRSRGG